MTTVSRLVLRSPRAPRYERLLRDMMRCLALLALLASAQGRAVNISNTWMLPEEGFPVFYRYFRDRISWYEADAVCQFHHANLVTVDTTAQYDAVRAYLKELDISSAVWVGLIRSNPDGDFTWTDYRGLSSEGYWSSVPDSATAPLCAAADPAADYRWEARACGGPMVASFICELPVPQWASGAEGCMVKSIPALTALYLPESAAVQLTADCGLAGVKIIQCTGNIKREELLKQLSCGVVTHEIKSTVLDVVNGSFVISTEETLFTQDSTQHLTTENTEKIETETNPSNTIMFQTPSTYDTSFSYIHDTPDTEHRVAVMNHIMPIHKSYNIDMVPETSHNLESNDIPTHPNKEGELTEEQINQIEDEKRIQHKIIHEEIARLGNPKSFEKIFSQSSDHFIPPLVMAKSRDNDDMEEISIQSKHAQQMAEEFKSKHLSTTREPDISTALTEKLIEQTTRVNVKNEKPSKLSYRKKYGDKQYETKTKNTKATKKRIEKVADYKTSFIEYNEDIVKSKDPLQSLPSKLEPLELTIKLKEPDELVRTNPTVESTTLIQTTVKIQPSTTNENNNNAGLTTNLGTPILRDFVQETGKVTIPNDKPNTSPIVIEVSTLMPIFTDASDKLESTQHPLEYSSSVAPDHVEANETFNATSGVLKPINNINKTTAEELPKNTQVNTTASEISATNSELLIPTLTNTSTTQTKKDLGSADKVNDEDVHITTALTTPTSDVIKSSTAGVKEYSVDSYEESVDAESPLLSAASEPIHRPNRFRKPQSAQNRMKKFALLRILG